jgi:GntR family transcriptional regulator
MPKSKTQTIADDLRRDIEAGMYQPGDRLPTEKELAKSEHAHRSTVREAMSQLTKLGLIEARAGLGTFVRREIVPFITDLSEGTATIGNNPDDIYYTEVRAQGRKPEADDPIVEMQMADAEKAAALNLEVGSHIISRHQPRFIDGRPYSMQTTFYELKLVTEHGASRLLLPIDIGEGTTQYLRELGIEQVGYRDVITVRPPDQNEIAFFQLGEDAPPAMFQAMRTSYDSAGRPVRLSLTVYPTDRNKFVINVDTPDSS